MPNVRRLRLRQGKPAPARWTRLAPPVNPLDNTTIARATSIVFHEMRETTTTLSVREAKDIVAWHEQSNPKPLSFWERCIKKVKSWRNTQ